MNKIMKRLSVFLVIVLCLTAFPYRATAATDGIVAGDIKWGENHSGTIAGTPVIYNFSLKLSGKVAVTFTFSDSNVNNYRFVIRDKAGNNLVYEHVGNGTYTVSADLLAGDYEIAIEDSQLAIDAKFWSDENIQYKDITDIEYRDSLVPGTRTSGYGSFTIVMGQCENEEFGSHIRYTYSSSDACIILTVDGEKVVINEKSVDDTKALYEKLLEKIGK